MFIKLMAKKVMAMNPKGSHVYRQNNDGFHSTPSGSNLPTSMLFYKHQIPSGLFLERIEDDIYKGLAELKELM